MSVQAADGPGAGSTAPGGDDRQRLEAVVSGRVQGVGFRAYVLGWARKLGLTGWVRNEPDGTVCLVAEGEPTALDRLVRLLHGGPPTAHVDRVEGERTPASGAFEAFTVER